MMIDELVQEYIGLREKRSEIKQAYDEQDRMLRERQKQIEAELLMHMQETGVTLLRTPAATVFSETKLYGNIADWRVFTDYVAKHQLFDLFERRIKPTALKQYVDELGTAPPGLNVVRVTEVRIRKL